VKFPKQIRTLDAISIDSNKLPGKISLVYQTLNKKITVLKTDSFYCDVVNLPLHTIKYNK
jgi:hypothetical protein